MAKGLGKRMVSIDSGLKALAGAAAFSMLCLFTPSAANAEFAVGAAKDAIHSRNTHALLLRYDYRPLRLGAFAMAWQRANTMTGAAGADFNIGFSIVDINIGGVYLPDTGEINGTRWNFSLRAAVNLWEHYRVELLHFSNGKELFDWQDGSTNKGWNFVALSYRF